MSIKILILVLSVVLIGATAQVITFYNQNDCKGKTQAFKPPTNSSQMYYYVGDRYFLFASNILNKQSKTMNYVTVTINRGMYNITVDFEDTGAFRFTQSNGIYSWNIVWALSPIPIPPSRDAISECQNVLDDGSDGLFMTEYMELRSFNTMY